MPQITITGCLTRQDLESYSRGVLPSELVPACEEHLVGCADCQAVLAELFESGSEPEWLASHHKTQRNRRIVPSRLSTLGVHDDATRIDNPLRASAHQLWHHFAVGATHMVTPRAAQNIPKSIGRYRIERLLGEGGFGRVYVAYDEKLKRHVALKVPHWATWQSQVHWDLMLTEAQTVAAFDHPSIVPLFDVASSDDVPLFLVSKLIVGETLADRLASSQLSPLEAAELVLHIAEALNYAHGHGVIHRDIKPQNVLIDNAGHAFLSDFGLAWRCADGSRTFATAGTPYYMSPEQLAGDSESIDQRSDIYSLGRVLREMLGTPNTSRRRSLFQVVTSVAKGCVGKRELTPYDSLNAICEKATATDPEARYQNITQLQDALRESISRQKAKRFRGLVSKIAVGVVVVDALTTTVVMMSRQTPTVQASTPVIYEDLPSSVELLLRAPPSEFAAIAEQLSSKLPQVVEMLREQVAKVSKPSEATLLDLERRHASGLALLKLGHAEDYWPLWKSQSDPRPLAVQLSRFGQDSLTPSLFIDRLRSSQGIKPVEALPTNFIARIFKAELSERRNLLLALAGNHNPTNKSFDSQFLDEVARLYELDADPCVHVLADHILAQAAIERPNLQRATGKISPGQGWYINSIDETMIVIQPSPSVIYPYSIASCEVQQQHFQVFLNETHYDWLGAKRTGDDQNRQPASRAQAHLSWYDCAAFCNWLSRREGLEECYLPNAEGRYAAGMSIKPQFDSLKGYRLPTSAEWETAARAAAFADMCFGNARYASAEYLWDATNSQGTPQAVGQLRPNNLGLFDVHGNVSEWTADLHGCDIPITTVRNEHRFSHRGGNARTANAADLQFDHVDNTTADDRTQLTGLRLARSLP